MSGLIGLVGSKSGVIGQTDFVTPHFEAYGASTRAYTGDASSYLAEMPNEKFDSHGWYDDTTAESEFKPQEAGIYLIGGKVGGYAQSGVDNMIKLGINIMKNASTVEADGFFDGRSNDFYNITVSAHCLVSFNGTSDYVWLRVTPWAQSSGNFVMSGGASNFWGFKVYNLKG